MYQQPSMKPLYLLLTVLEVWALSACGKKPQAAPDVPTSALIAPAAPASPTATRHPAFAKLEGKWRRPDGGYVIDIASVDATSGKMDAAYFNPQPIHVAKAMASQEGASTGVFVELQGVNYPGSTYTLVYAPAADQLVGTYYQAALRQQFEVVFQRAK